MKGDRGLLRGLTIQCRWPTIKKGTPCSMPAGHDTGHVGYGPCKTHGRKKNHDAWRMAVDIARELDISPWDALLMSVRTAAGRVAWVDDELKTVVARNDGDMSQAEVVLWLKESRNERTLLAKMAKAAIDAGVAERMVRNVEMEGKIVAEVIGRVIDKLDLSAEKRMLAFDEAHRQLLTLDSPSGTPATVEGTWTPPGVVDPKGLENGGEGESEEGSS